MTNKERFESAKEIYASFSVDVEEAIKKCMEVERGTFRGEKAGS